MLCLFGCRVVDFKTFYQPEKQNIPLDELFIIADCIFLIYLVVVGWSKIYDIKCDIYRTF